MTVVADPGEVLLIDKPYRWTSFDVVRRVKKALNTRKVGHAGTLDPLATGLLVVCTGKKTKTIQFIQDAEKEYTGTFRIGSVTASFDLESPVENEQPIDLISAEQVREVVMSMIGEQLQTPPMHSAVKVDGKRAYEMARKGEVTELKSRPINIREFEITRLELPDLDFRIVCTKGTYIRSIARDLGEKLGVGAHMTALCRTRIGDLLLSNALSINDLDARRKSPEGGEPLGYSQPVEN